MQLMTQPSQMYTRPAIPATSTKAVFSPNTQVQEEKAAPMIYWQAGELGAVDAGGGGTIAKFVAHMDVDTVDLGVPILSMHAPFELSSKLDVYHTYKAFKAFYAS